MRFHSFVILSTLLAVLSCIAPVACEPDFLSAANDAADVANKAYDKDTGLWGGLWWQSANMLTTLGDLVSLDGSYLSTAQDIFSNTFTQAAKSNGGNFLDGYYDDEGWWALAWIKAYDVTGDVKYLQTAESIFEDMMTGTGGPCGGLWWNKAHTQIAAIANELYMSTAAHLAVRVGSKQTDYIGIATTSLNWFLDSHFISSKTGLVANSLGIETCKPGGIAFTYNQGVLIGGLVSLHHLTANATYVDIASDLAVSTITNLTDDGILTEIWGNEYLSLDAAQFKGVFVRNLQLLQHVAPNEAYVTFLQSNAASILKSDSDSEGDFGPRWQGPFPESAISVPAQGSAMDCFIAAAAVS